MRKYCAYQERCHEEVRTKLLSLKVYGKELEAVMSKLIEEDFLNEERFAKAYAGGKFRMLKWGREKIIRELKSRKVSAYCIHIALQEIDAKDYETTFQKLIQTAFKKYKSANLLETKNKAAKFLITKGYEKNLVWKHVSEYLK